MRDFYYKTRVLNYNVLLAVYIFIYMRGIESKPDGSCHSALQANRRCVGDFESS